MHHFSQLACNEVRIILFLGEGVDSFLSRLNNTKREDITLILFQIWVLGMSIVAVRLVAPHQYLQFICSHSC
jgi:hypothetical protein